MAKKDMFMVYISLYVCEYGYEYEYMYLCVCINSVFAVDIFFSFT